MSPIRSVLFEVSSLNIKSFLIWNFLNQTLDSLIIIDIIGLVVRMLAYSPGDLDSIPGRVIPKTLKLVLDISLLNTQQYKVRI